jgi:hypothetical protein
MRRHRRQFIIGSGGVFMSIGTGMVGIETTQSNDISRELLASRIFIIGICSAFTNNITTNRYAAIAKKDAPMWLHVQGEGRVPTLGGLSLSMDPSLMWWTEF